MMAAAEAEQFEAAARLRDQLSTVHQLQEKQRIATAEDDDADVFGYHFEDGNLAVNLFHVRNGKIVDRREFFWEDLPELLESTEPEQSGSTNNEVADEQKARNFRAGPILSALLKQLYIDQQYVPRSILVPVDFDDRETLAALLSPSAPVTRSRSQHPSAVTRNPSSTSSDKTRTSPTPSDSAF